MKADSLEQAGPARGAGAPDPAQPAAAESGAVVPFALPGTGFLKSPPPPPPPSTPAPSVTLGPEQKGARDALRLALDEGYAYAALTGPAGTGKTAVLTEVLSQTRGVRVLRIFSPDKVTDQLGAQIEEVALAEAAKPEADRHVAIVVDDAHLASVSLLDSLARLAGVRRTGGRLPQVVLVGQPVLWDRLKAERFRPLERRVVMRHALLPGATEDPWAKVEQALVPSGPTHEPAAPLAPAMDTPALQTLMRDALASRQARPPAAAPAPLPKSSPGSHLDDLLARHADLAAKPPARRTGSLVVTATILMLIFGGTVIGVLGLAPKLTAGLASGPAPTQLDAPTPILPTPVLPTPVPPTAAVAPLAVPSVQTAPPAEPPPAPAALLPVPPPETPQITPQETTHVTPAAPEPPAAKETAAPDPAGTTALQVVPSAAAPPSPNRPQAAAAAVSPEIAALLLRRAEERLALGDIAAARSFLERAASAGNDRAALLAGQTYDAAVLRPDAAGMADAAMATSWYRRAATLGNKDAAARLRQIGADQ